MGAQSQWNLQWANLNSQRSYPMIHAASGQDQTETIVIPDNFILAMTFPVHAGMSVNPERFYIQQLAIYPTGYSIGIGYDNGGSLPLVASVNIAKSTHTEFRTYALPGSDDFDDSVGAVMIGALDDIDNLPAGVYTFDPSASYLEAGTVIRPMLRGITSITAVNGSDRSAPLYGDVELVAGNNMRITALDTPGQPGLVTFSAIQGEGLNEACACEEEGEGPAIRFINGIPPLPNGNFRVVGNSCLDVQPITNGLQLLDTCSEPCCGCEELEALTRQIDRFADGVTTMQGFANRLSSEVSQMNQVVLGSRLSDAGCIEC